MESRIAKEIRPRLEPVAILFTDDRPAGALQFQPGQWGCAMTMLTAAGHGRTAVFDRAAHGCGGAKVGLGFGGFGQMPGGIEYFLSTGRGQGFPAGEGYRQTPALAQAFTEELPIADIPYTYVVFKPLATVDPEQDNPQLITFLVNADQLAALVVLQSYDRPGSYNAIIPSAAGCHSVCLIPYREAQGEAPRGVVGLMDISARPHVDPDILSFTVPFKRFLEMEANIPGSFFEREAWQRVAPRLKCAGKKGCWC